MLERIAARRAELVLLEEELVKRLADVRVERDRLVAAERVVQQNGEQGFGVGALVARAPGRGSNDAVDSKTAAKAISRRCPVAALQSTGRIPRR